MNEPFYATRPIRDGGVNANYIALDKRWGLSRGDLAAFSVHVHGKPDQKYSVTKAIGGRGNSLVIYIPRVWNLEPGTMCVVEVTPLDYSELASETESDGDEEDDNS